MVQTQSSFTFSVQSSLLQLLAEALTAKIEANINNFITREFTLRYLKKYRL